MTNTKCLYGFHLPTNAVTDNYRLSLSGITCDFEATSLAESFLLTTCERFDVYIYSEDYQSVRDWFHNLCPNRKVDIRQGEEAVRYLFETTAGIHSSNLGESEILHQVKKCLTRQLSYSKEAAVTKRLLQKAIETGKLVRTKTGIGNASLSYAGSVYDLVRRHAKSSYAEVGIIGGGSLGRSILKILLKKSDFKPTLISRCEANRNKINHAFGIDVLSPEQFKSNPSKFSAIVGAASTTESLMDASSFEPETLIVDLGMPPVFKAPDKANSLYFDLSDLHDVFKKHRSVRKKHLPKAHSIIRVKINEFSEWLDRQQLSTIIQYLSGKTDRWKTLYLPPLMPNKG